MDNKLDLTSNAKQEVVPIKIIPDCVSPDAGCRDLQGDNSYAMEIESGGMVIRISNDIDSSLLSHTLKTLGDMS